MGLGWEVGRGQGWGGRVGEVSGVGEDILKINMKKFTLSEQNMVCGIVVVV